MRYEFTLGNSTHASCIRVAAGFRFFLMIIITGSVTSLDTNVEIIVRKLMTMASIHGAAGSLTLRSSSSRGECRREAEDRDNKHYEMRMPHGCPKDNVRFRELSRE